MKIFYLLFLVFLFMSCAERGNEEKKVMILGATPEQIVELKGEELPIQRQPRVLTLNLRALSLPKSRREKKQRKQKILRRQMPFVTNCLQKELSSKTPAKVWYGIKRSKERWKKESILI